MAFFEENLNSNSVNLEANKEVLRHNLMFVGNTLYMRIISARSVDSSEMPAWMSDQTMVEFGTEIHEIAKFENGIVVMDVAELRDVWFKMIKTLEDYQECYLFAMHCLFQLNKHVYKMLENARNCVGTTSGCNMKSLAIGLLTLVSDPKKISQIESVAKTIGEKFAISQIENDISCVSGKKALVLSYDQLHSIKTMNMSEAVPVLQSLVQDGAMSLEQVERFLEGMRYAIKFGIDTPSVINSFFALYGDDIAKKKMNLEWLLSTALKTCFTLKKRHAYRGGLNLIRVMMHYMDAIKVLPQWKYPTNNIELFHVITTRNKKIFEVRRPDEFAAAAVRLRKLAWENEPYCFRPIQTEDELFYIGERYNNCLPVYRDKIIDEGAVVIAIYKRDNDGNLENCPEVVFETSPVLDIIQIKTFNDQDVTDKFMIDMISAWKKAKYYLLSGNRSVYRDPEPETAKGIKSPQDADPETSEYKVEDVVIENIIEAQCGQLSFGFGA